MISIFIQPTATSRLVQSLTQPSPCIQPYESMLFHQHQRHSSRLSRRSLFTWFTLALLLTLTGTIHNVSGLKYDGVTITIASASPNIILNFETMAPRFTNLTGLKINNYGLPKAQLQTNLNDDLAKGSPYFDCFSAPMHWAIDWIIDGHILKLTDRIKADATTLQWLDISSFFRNEDASYQGDIWTFPIDGDVHYLHSRMDVLNKAGFTDPPSSWSEFFTMAAAVNGTDMNGDGVPDPAICVVQEVLTDAFYVTNGLIAGFLQYQGTQQGFFFDTETMEPFSLTPGWKQAMNVYKSFQQYGMRNMTQADVGVTRQVFLQQGACAFTIDWDDIFVQANATKYRDVVRSGWVPGPDEVYDRVDQVMVKCSSDPKLCPYAVNNINRTPFAASGGWTSAISSHVPAIRQDACYDFFSYMIEPAQHNELVQSGNGYDMNRLSQTNAEFWHKAGYTGSQVDTSLTNIGTMLASPNMAIDLNIPQNEKYLTYLDLTLNQFLLGQIDVDTFGQMVYDQWEIITNAAPTGRSGQLDAYRGILGLQPLNRQTPVYLSTAIYRFTLALSGIGMGTVLIFGVAVILFRDRPVMRASSPALLLMMAVGASAVFFAMPLLALDSATASVDVLNRVCPAQTYLFGVAFTLVFGSLAVRNWRIRRLFTDNNLQVVSISDWELIAKVGAILVFELLYCAIWNAVDPLSHTVSSVDSSSTYESCTSNHTSIWLTLYLIPKGILMLFVLYLAYVTRTIELGQFNESKELAFVSYNVAFVIIVALPLALALGGNGSVNAAALTRILAGWFCMTLSLACVFMPKLLRVNDTARQLMKPSYQPRTPVGTPLTYGSQGMADSLATSFDPRGDKVGTLSMTEKAAIPMAGSPSTQKTNLQYRLGFGNTLNTVTQQQQQQVNTPGMAPSITPVSSVFGRITHLHFHVPLDTPINMITAMMQTIRDLGSDALNHKLQPNEPPMTLHVAFHADDVVFNQDGVAVPRTAPHQTRSLTSGGADLKTTKKIATHTSAASATSGSTYPVPSFPASSMGPSSSSSSTSSSSSSMLASPTDRTFYFQFQLPQETPSNQVAAMIQTIQQRLGQSAAEETHQPTTNQLRDLHLNHDSINIEIHQPLSSEPVDSVTSEVPFSHHVQAPPSSSHHTHGLALSPIPMTPADSMSTTDDGTSSSSSSTSNVDVPNTISSVPAATSPNPSSSVNLHLPPS